MSKLFGVLLLPFTYLYENGSSHIRVVWSFMLVAIPALAIGIFLHSKFQITPTNPQSKAIRQFNEAKFFAPANGKSDVIHSIEDIKSLNASTSSSKVIHSLSEVKKN